MMQEEWSREYIAFARKTMYRGKSRFAVVLDRLLIVLISGVFMYALLRVRHATHIYALYISFIISALLMASLLCLARIRLRRACESLEKTWAARYLQEQLLLLSPAIFRRRVNEALLHDKLADDIIEENNVTYAVHAASRQRLLYLQRPYERALTSDLLLDRYHACAGDAGLLISTANPDAQAAALLKRLPSFELRACESLSALYDPASVPSTEELRALYAQEGKQEPRRGFAAALLTKVHARRYAWSGVMLTLLSFFTLYKTLYLIVAGMLFVLAVLAAWRSNPYRTKVIDGFSREGR